MEPEVNSSSGTEVEADRVSRNETDLLDFSGNVQLKQAGQTLRAENILFNEQTEQLTASGSVVLERSDFSLTTERLNLDQVQNSAEIEAASFELRGRHARGSASKIDILDESQSRFNDIFYTACDPGDRDWHFTADELKLNDETGLGSATNATMYFQGIPFFYLPYFQFPIDDRRISGVLTPTFNFSDADNSHFALPIYWNIAPNFDTTFTPAWYPERGLFYRSEHRYLLENNNGQIDYAYLDDDKTADTRWFKKWQHNASYAQSTLTGSWLLQEVSDDEFFSDFDRLTPGSDDVDYLDRQISLTHNSDSWKTALLWQNYQIVDPSTAISDRPYQRLPRLTVNSDFEPLQNGFHFDLQSELVSFKRESSINGDRAHLLPTLSWTSSESWYFFKPQLQYALTEYVLDNNTLGDNEITRNLPITSIDSGLIFERVTGPENSWLQTLEPRLYIVSIPFEAQNDIPDFDTSLLTESYDNFFRANRFRGADRIGDTEQVSFGLGTRIYDNDSGRQLAYARLAQTYYAEDRQVSLDGITQRDDKSNLIAQLDFNPDPYWQLGSKLVYDETIDDFTEREFSVNWAKDGFAANLEYFFNDQTLEQSLLSVVYPVNDSWTLLAKYHQSLLFDEPVENLFGISYESCCWGLKILASQTSDDDFVETDKAVFIELTLKGLTRAGDDIDARLSQAISGYQPRF